MDRTQTKTGMLGKKADPMTDLVGALTMFSGVIALWLLPRHFGPFTLALAGILGVLGFYGVGKGIDGLVRMTPDVLRDRSDQVFTSLGVGISGLLIWAILAHYLPWRWIQIPAFLILLVSFWGISEGLLSALAGYLADRHTVTTAFATAHMTDEQRAKVTEARLGMYRHRLRVLLTVIGVLVGFLANALTVLQILGVL